MTTLQKTISYKVNCNGIGLHSGKEVRMTLLPGECDTGIIFKRTDVKGKNNLIKANYANVTQTTLGTVISNEDGVTISTIEHFMSAIWCLGIDNIIVEVDNVELPIMDGSSEPFIFLTECAGSKTLNKPRQIIEILREVSFEDGDKFIKVKPSKSFSINLDIDFNHPQIKEANYHFDESKSSFKSDISRARTFCFKSEIEHMQKIGLAKGGSLDNAIVIDDDGILNESPLRYKDEFVKHKILDFIGDIYLAGNRICGEFNAFKAGHGINNAFLRKLLSNQDNWRFVCG
jgi:UDP-3-O-[3-hydroxymyristoyl] N-acetylglucosamine deacetylase